MFQLNGQPLPIDTPFTVGEGDDAIQYPANWLRLASAEERAAIGITEVPDPQPYDDRFYWGAGNPKDVAMVRTMLLDQIKATAYGLLARTDYKLVRKVETGEDVDADTLAFRTAVRAAYATNKAAVDAAATTDDLAVLQLQWPEVSQ